MHDALKACPQCRAIYPPDEDRCPACGAALVFREQLTPGPARASFGRLEADGEQVVLCEVEGSLAQKLSGDLNRAGIPNRVEPAEGPVGESGGGRLALKVGVADLEAAREIEEVRRRVRACSDWRRL